MQKKWWKKIIFIFTSIAVISLGTYGYFYLREIMSKNWKHYSSVDDRFYVQFPSDPKETNERLDIANKTIDYHEVSSQDKDTLYSVSYIDFPGHWKWLGKEKLLTKSFDMFIENEKGIEEVVEKKLITYKGYSALTYRLKQDGKEIWGRFIVAGNTLYRVTVSYPLAVTEKIDVQPFLDSFQVKG